MEARKKTIFSKKLFFHKFFFSKKTLRNFLGFFFSKLYFLKKKYFKRPVRAGEQKRLEQESMKNNELANNAQEIRNQILGDTLTENPDVARSAFGSHRVIPDRWKGMSDAELVDIRQLQESQRRENMAKLEAENEREKEWSLHQTSTAKAGILMERAQNRQSAEERKQLDLENAELARQQQAKKKTYDQVYTNVPTDGYYAQFNTTTR